MSQDTPTNDPDKRPPDNASDAPRDAEADGVIPLEPRDEPPPVPRGKPHIDSPSLIDDFDEDADFDSDPELEAVVKGIPVGAPEKPAPRPTAKATDPDDDVGGPICPSASWRVPTVIGCLLLITAAIFSGVYAEHSYWAYVLRTVYWAALHTATGVGAVVIAAILLGRKPGPLDGAAARMFMVVTMFLVIFSLDIPIPTRIEETLLAAAAYFGGLVVAFKLAPKDAAVVGGAHFGLALLVALGSTLSAVISAGGVAS